MAYRVKKKLPCIECGDPTDRRLRYTRDPCCLECAIQRNIAGVYNLVAHRGPRHDLWVAGMEKFIDRESRGTGGGGSMSRSSIAGDLSRRDRVTL